MYFIVAPLYLILTNEFTVQIDIYSSIVTKGLLFCILAFLSCYCGYISDYGNRFAKLIPINKEPFNTKKIIKFACFLEFLAIGLIALEVYFAKIPFKSLFALSLEYDYSSKWNSTEGNLIGLFHMGEALFIPAVLILVAFWHHEKLSNIIKINILLIFIFYLLTAARWRLILFTLSLFNLYLIRKKRKISLYKILIIGICVMIVMPIIGYYRSISGPEKTVMIRGDKYIKSVMSSLSIFETFLVIIDNIPKNMDFLYGDVLLYIPKYFIPRKIWPDKPYPKELEIIWALTGGRNLGYTAPLFGELYINFGIVGVIVGMFIFGVFCRTIYEYWKKKPENITSQLILAITSPYIISLIDRGYIIQHLYIIFNIYIPLIIAFIFSSKMIRIKF
jgi:oligosaccharide repeat unit polymerase